MKADEISRLQAPAAEWFEFVTGDYRSEKGIHAETLIGALAAITGHQVIVACGGTSVPFQQSPFIFSDDANGLLAEDGDRGLTVWQLIVACAGQAGVGKADLPDLEDVFGRNAEAIGRTPYPPLSIPAQNFPQEWSPNAPIRFKSDIEAFRLKHDSLQPDELALAFALSTGLGILATRNALDPKVATQLAVEMIVGTAKLNPNREMVA